MTISELCAAVRLATLSWKIVLCYCYFKSRYLLSSVILIVLSRHVMSCQILNDFARFAELVSDAKTCSSRTLSYGS